MVDFTVSDGTKPLKRGKVDAFERQKEGDVGNAIVGVRDRQRFPYYPQTQSESFWSQHQSKIPFVSFFLESAPADICTIC